MGKIKDLLGQRFGKLVVIKYAGKEKRGRSLWLCQCDCGNQKVIPARHLLHNDAKSCGCSQHQKPRVTTEDDRSDMKIILHSDIISGSISYFEMSNEDGKATIESKDEETNIFIKDLANKEDIMSVKIDKNSVSGTLYGTDTDVSGNKTTMKIVFSIKNNKISDKKSEISSSFSIYNGDSTDPMATVALTSKVDLDAKPKEFDKSNVVMFDKLTEEDMMQIQTNLLSLIEKLGIELPTADNNDLTA